MAGLLAVRTAASMAACSAEKKVEYLAAQLVGCLAGMLVARRAVMRAE